MSGFLKYVSFLHYLHSSARQGFVSLLVPGTIPIDLTLLDDPLVLPLYIYFVFFVTPSSPLTSLFKSNPCDRLLKHTV